MHLTQGELNWDVEIILANPHSIFVLAHGEYLSSPHILQYYFCHSIDPNQRFNSFPLPANKDQRRPSYSLIIPQFVLITRIDRFQMQLLVFDKNWKLKKEVS